MSEITYVISEVMKCDFSFDEIKTIPGKIKYGKQYEEYHVDFEKLTETNIDEVYISGLRAYDMAVRLKTAGLNPNKFVIEEQYEALTEAIKNGSCDKLYILATYTAMINYRKYLHSKGYIKNLW